MKSVIVITTVISLIIPAFSLANNYDNNGDGSGDEKKDIFVEFIERDSNYKLHYISKSRWLPVRSTLVIACKGTGMKYTFFGEKGNEIHSQRLKDGLPVANGQEALKPRDVVGGIVKGSKVKEFLKDETGDTYDVKDENLIVLSIEDFYYRGAKYLTVEYWPTIYEPTQRYYKKFEIVEARFEWAKLSNFAITPLVNIEIGKKNPTGEKINETSFAFGIEYLFFYKAREHTLLDNFGGGFTCSYSKTPIWNESAQEMEDTLVTTTGLAVAYKFDPSPLLFTAGCGVNLNGDDRFLQILIGFSVKPGD